jgi:hypothetical protein
MNSPWLFQVHFQAADKRDAEDYAAALADLVETFRRGRTALLYLDPVTSEFSVWSEPAMGTAELKLNRSLL